MKVDRNTVIFEVDEKTISKINLAISAADIDADAEFRKWADYLAELALRKINNSKTESIFNSIKDTFSIETQTRNRIVKWASSKKGVNYNILKSYFESEMSHIGFANKDEMEKIYQDDISNVAPFLGNFRILCCESALSGQIFNYDKNTKKVTLTETYSSLIIEHKNDFLN